MNPISTYITSAFCVWARLGMLSNICLARNIVLGLPGAARLLSIILCTCLTGVPRDVVRKARASTAGLADNNRRTSYNRKREYLALEIPDGAAL